MYTAATEQDDPTCHKIRDLLNELLRLAPRHVLALDDVKINGGGFETKSSI